MVANEVHSSQPGTATSAIYLYGIVRRGSVDAITSEGVFGRSVEIVESGDLAALTSELPDEQPQIRRADLRRHLDVLEEAFAKTTVLPCRFGTAVASADAARTVLGERVESLAAGL